MKGIPEEVTQSRSRLVTQPTYLYPSTHHALNVFLVELHYCLLEPRVLVDILYGVVKILPVLFDEAGSLCDYLLLLVDLLLHTLLLEPKLADHKIKLSVALVVLFQLLVHLLDLLIHIGDLRLARRNLPLELLDLVIKDKSVGVGVGGGCGRSSTCS